MSQILDLDLAPFRGLGEQFPSKQFANFNEKASRLYIFSLTRYKVAGCFCSLCQSECVGLNLRNHPVIVGIEVKCILANDKVRMCVYYPIGRGGYILSTQGCETE